MIILAVFISVILLLISLIGVFNNQPGWLFGILIGSLIEIINIVLLFKGSESSLKEEKSGFFVLAYFLRMVLFAGGIILCAVLQYFLKIEIFKYSLWGVLIGYSPTQLVVIIEMLRSGKNPSNIAQKDEQ